MLTQLFVALSPTIAAVLAAVPAARSAGDAPDGSLTGSGAAGASHPSAGALAAAGYANPILVIWTVFGLLALGVAFTLLRSTVRRSRRA